MQRMIFTCRQVAEILEIAEWKIRRLFEDGDLPEPERFGGKRVITPAGIPAIIDALRRRGWIAAAAEVEQHAHAPVIGAR